MTASASLRSTALWGLAAGVGGASTWFIVGLLPAVLLGVIGIAVGITTARAAPRRSSDWWIGVAAVTLGAVPLGGLVFYYLAVFMGWGVLRPVIGTPVEGRSTPVREEADDPACDLLALVLLEEVTGA